MDALEIVRTVGPEFSGVDDETVERWIGLSRPLVSRKAFGSLYEQAVALLACHRMSLAGIGGDGGSGGADGGAGSMLGLAGPFRVASYSEGETSVSFSSSQQTNLQADAEYGLTQYGLQYLTLRRGVVVPIVCSGEGGGRDAGR